MYKNKTNKQNAAEILSCPFPMPQCTRTAAADSPLKISFAVPPHPLSKKVKIAQASRSKVPSGITGSGANFFLFCFHFWNHWDLFWVPLRNLLRNEGFPCCCNLSTTRLVLTSYMPYMEFSIWKHNQCSRWWPYHVNEWFNVMFMQGHINNH